MEDLERELLRGLEGIDFETVKFAFFAFVAVAGIALAARFVLEYAATQASIRASQNALVRAQEDHLKAHADLRKSLVGLARQNKNEAVDLLAKLEAAEVAVSKA